MQSKRSKDMRLSLPEGLFTPIPKTPDQLHRTASCETRRSATPDLVHRRPRTTESSQSHLPSVFSRSFEGSRRSSARRALLPESLMESARSGPGTAEPAWRQDHHAVAARSPTAMNRISERKPPSDLEPLDEPAGGHPLLAVFQESWNNFELFAEFAELGQLQESHLLSSLGKRSTTMDFLELLELLKSLDLLADREGFFDSTMTLTMTDVHNVFTEVNVKSYTKWWSSGGALGDEDRNELVFEEFQMLMLCLAKMMGVELDNLAAASGQEMFKEAGIDELIASAQKRSLMNMPGAARHLERLRNLESVQAGFTSIEAANKACAEDNFERARSLAYGAAAAFIRHGRPDLLCEVRLLDNIISRREKSVSIHKRKIQIKVEAKLEETTELALDLQVDRAAELLTSAGKMVDSAKLPMKGRLKKKFNAAGEALLCAEQAIEGDQKLALAWNNIQRDGLEEGGQFLDEAVMCYGDIQIRTQQVRNCEEALARKRNAESTIRAGGTQLIEQARDDISNFRFDDAAKTLEDARNHFLQWTDPVGKNQSLVEGLTFLIKSSWNNKELYNLFSSYDDKNLSGQGSRACLMDFTELLHLLRYFGILSDRKMAEDNAPAMERIASANDKQSQKKQLADACTNEQIRAESSCKLAKADVYEEFRAVNKKSMQDLLQGNIEADDDMSSLDFQEYQLLMLRLGKLLGLPLTDVGCSPLFLKDIREVEQMKETLLFVKREAMQGIVQAGEKILLSARNLMQEKLFQEARDELQVAVAEFQKLDDENMQRINMASCRRLAEQIDKEERKENTRRADATALAEAAVRRAEEILADFDIMGARYDEHQFDICEREAESARKYFKSAQSFGTQQKDLIIDILQRAHNSREVIIKLRNAVGDGRDELDSAKLMIQHLLDTSSPPFERVLAHLVDAKQFFLKAKVKDELTEVEEILITLVDMVGEWIRTNVESGWTHVRQAETILEKTEASQLKDAPETEGLFTQAFQQHEIATRWFHKAKMADCVIQHHRQSSGQYGSFTRRGTLPDESDDDPYKDEVVQNLKHRIVDRHEGWLQTHGKEVEDAMKIVQECRDAISAKAFNSSKELLKKARQLLKGDQDHVVQELQRAISTAEMNDKESTKTIREQGLALLDVIHQAVQDGDFELAFDSSEQAVELFDRARDHDSMKAVTQTRALALEKARQKVEEAVGTARQSMLSAEQSLQCKAFEEAGSAIQHAKEAMSEPGTLNALRVLATDSGVNAEQKLLKEGMEELERRLGDEQRRYGIVLQHEREQAAILSEELAARAMRAREMKLERRYPEVKALRERFELAVRLKHGEEDPKLDALRPALETMEAEVEKPRAELRVEAEGRLEQAEREGALGSAKAAMESISLALRLFLEARDMDGCARSIQQRDAIMAAAASEKERLFYEATEALEQAKEAIPLATIVTASKAASAAAACRNDQLLLGSLGPCSPELRDTIEELQNIEKEANELRIAAEQAISLGVDQLVEQVSVILGDVKTWMQEKKLEEARMGLTEVQDLLTEAETLSGQAPALVHEVSALDAWLRSEEDQWKRDEMLLRGVAEVDAEGEQGTVASPSPDTPVAEAGSDAPQPSTPGNVADSSLPTTPMGEQTADAGNVESPAAASLQSAADSSSAIPIPVSSPNLLHKLCMEGDFEVLQRILLHSPSLEDADDEGLTALMIAVQFNHLHCARALIDAGALVNARENRKRTVLMIGACAKIGSGLGIARMLVQAGAIVSAVDEEGENVLHHCARSGRDDLIEEFLQNLGEEALSESLKSTAQLPRGFSTKSLRGLSAGESPSSPPPTFNSATASSEAMQEILAQTDERQDIWVERNSQLLDGMGDRCETPITVAVKSQNIDCVKRLISWGADPRAKDGEGYSCLHCAAQTGDMGILTVLADQLQEVNGMATGGETALWSASAGGRVEAVSFLLERKADPQLKDKQGWTPLHAACWAGGAEARRRGNEDEGRGEVIRLLLDLGLDAFAGDRRGRDALDLVAMHGSQAALAGLIDTLGEEMVRYVGEHLLHVACWAGQIEIARSLIDMGCDAMSLTDSGFAPFHAACAQNRVDVVHMLATSGMPSPDEHFPSPAQVAVLTRSREVLAAILESQPEWAWAQDQHGWNALHVAALIGDSEAARCILETAGGSRGGQPVFTQPVIEMADRPSSSYDGSAEDQQPVAMHLTQHFISGDDAISIANKCLQLAREGRALSSPDAYSDLLLILQKHVRERPVSRTSSVPTRVPSQTQESIDFKRTESWNSSGTEEESVFRLTDGVVRRWFPLPYRPEEHGLWRSVTKSMTKNGAKDMRTEAERTLWTEFEDLSKQILEAETEHIRQERKKAVGLRTLVLQANARIRSGVDRDAYSLMVRAEALAGDREYQRRVCLEHRGALRQMWLEGLGQHAKELLDAGNVDATRAVIEVARAKAGWDGSCTDGGALLQSVQNRLVESEVHARLAEVIQSVAVDCCAESRYDQLRKAQALMAEAWAYTEKLVLALVTGEVLKDQVVRARELVKEVSDAETKGGVLSPEEMTELGRLDAKVQRIEGWFEVQDCLLTASECTGKESCWFGIELAESALHEAEGNLRVIARDIAKKFAPLNSGWSGPQTEGETSLLDNAMLNSQALTVKLEAVQAQQAGTGENDAMLEPEQAGSVDPNERSSRQHSDPGQPAGQPAVADEDVTSTGVGPTAAGDAAEAEDQDATWQFEKDEGTDTEDVPEHEQVRVRRESEELEELEKLSPKIPLSPKRAQNIALEEGDGAEYANFWEGDREIDAEHFEEGMLILATASCSRAKARIESRRRELVDVELAVVMDDLLEEVGHGAVSDGVDALQAHLQEIMAAADASREASEYQRCLQQLQEWEAVMHRGLYPAQLRSIDEFVAMQDSVSALLATQQEAEERLASAFALLEAHDLPSARQQYAEARRRFRDARDKRSEKREQFYAFENAATKEEVCGLVFEMVEAAAEQGEASRRAAAKKALAEELATAKAELEKGDWRALERQLEESEATFRLMVGDDAGGAGSEDGGQQELDIGGLRAQALRLRRAEEAMAIAEEEKAEGEAALAARELERARAAVERGEQRTANGGLDEEAAAAWEETWARLRGEVDWKEVEAVMAGLVTEVVEKGAEEKADALRVRAASAVEHAREGMAALSGVEEAEELREGLEAVKGQLEHAIAETTADGAPAEELARLEAWVRAAESCLRRLEARRAAEEALGEPGVRVSRDQLQAREEALETASGALREVEEEGGDQFVEECESPTLVSSASLAELMAEVEAAAARVHAEMEVKEAAEEEIKALLGQAEADLATGTWAGCLEALDRVRGLESDISEVAAGAVSQEAGRIRGQAERGRRREELQRKVAEATQGIPELLAAKMFDRAREAADRVLDHKRELLKLDAEA